MNITLQQMQAAVEAAHQKALAMSVKVNIAVANAGANLVAFAYMDGAWRNSLDISIKMPRVA